MALGMTPAAKRYECVFVAQILAPPCHVVNVRSIAATDRAVWV